MLAVVIDFPRADKASGTTLVVCLLLLVPLLLLGVGTMESAVLGERMAANIEDRARAFDAAETALEAGEAWLRSQAVLPIASSEGAGGVWREGVLGQDLSDSRVWWDVSGTDVQWWESHGTAVGDVTSLAVPAHYVIEQYRLVSDGESVDVNGRLQPILAFHRITTIGIGRRVITRVRLQSTFARRYERLKEIERDVNSDKKIAKCWLKLAIKVAVSLLLCALTLAQGGESSLRHFIVFQPLSNCCEGIGRNFLMQLGFNNGGRSHAPVFAQYDDDQFVNVDSADRVVERGAVKGEGPLHSLGADLASRIGDTPTRRNNALFGRQSWRLLD